MDLKFLKELYDRTDLTLAEFADELDITSDHILMNLYPEFYDIKYSAMEQTQRSIELENIKLMMNQLEECKK